MNADSIVLCTAGASLFCLVLFLFPVTGLVYGVEVLTEADKPHGKSLSDWFAKYWNWTASLTPQEATQTTGCVINNSSMVMLNDPAVGGLDYRYNCEITSNQSIMIPLWIAWCDNHEHRTYSGEQLTKCAREEYNQGRIAADLIVDDVKVADLDVNNLNYDINANSNVIELNSTGFNFHMPENSRLEPSGTPEGTWYAGAHGWLVFLEPLPPGEHTIFNQVRVDPTEPHGTRTDMIYDLTVR